MEIIKAFILRYKIPLAITGLCLIAALILYIAEKYINNAYSIIILLLAAMYCAIAFIFFAFIWLHSSIKYTAWSILTGIIGIVIATSYSMQFLVITALSGWGSISFILVVTLGYCIGSATMLLLKASYRSLYK